MLREKTLQLVVFYDLFVRGITKSGIDLVHEFQTLLMMK